MTAEEVAATIAHVAASPRPETWVPCRSRAIYVASSLLPHRLKDGVSRALGAYEILSDPDRTARAAYEHQARGELQRDA